MPRRIKLDPLPPIITTLITKREEAGLTRSELADKLGYDHDTIYGWERGTIHPRFLSLVNWCQFFRLAISTEDQE